MRESAVGGRGSRCARGASRLQLAEAVEAHVGADWHSTSRSSYSLYNEDGFAMHLGVCQVIRRKIQTMQVSAFGKSGRDG